MPLRSLFLLVVVTFMSSCSQGGPLKGKVSVEGGSPANIPVFVFGPQSVAAVTDAEGNFTTPGLLDGAYLVRVTVSGAEVPEQTANVTMAGGKPSAEPMLAFKMPSGVIQGSVVMSDASAPTNVVVSLSGAGAPRSVAAGTDGSFKFEKVASGVYVLTVAGPDTRERSVSQAVTASATPSDVGMVKLTPIGRVEGTVTGPGAARATVSIAGQPFTATPDAMGKFVFEGVPAGMQTVVATAPAVPVGTASANAMVTVARGMTASAMLALTADPPRTGTVKGSVTYAVSSRNSDITVRAQGLAMPSASPDAMGGFTLALPVGRWTIEATAPSPFPPRILGTVDVVEGQTLTLPAGVMSLYVPVLDARAPIVDWQMEALTPTHGLYRVRASAMGSAYTWYVLDRTTLASRAFFTAPLSQVTQAQLSSRYALLAVNTGLPNTLVLLFDLTTGQTTTYGMSEAGRPVSSYLLSSGNEALFLQTVALSPTQPARVERITLGATPTRVGFDNFHSFGVDRAFYTITTGATFSVNAVNVADAPTASLFTNASFFSATPVPWARTGCTGLPQTCTLAIAMPAANTSNPAVAVSGQGLAVLAPNGRYPCFRDATVRVWRVDAMTGGTVQLPSGTDRVFYNVDNTRFAYSLDGPGTTALREEPLATATGMVAPVLTVPRIAGSGYVSALRFIAVTQTATQLLLNDVKAPSATAASTATPLPDVRQPGVNIVSEYTLLNAELAYRTTTGRVSLLVGDSALRTIDASAQPFTQGGVPIESPMNFPYAVLRQASNSYIVDMATGMATPGPSPGVGLFGTRIKTKAWVVSLVDQTYSLTDPVTSRTFPVNEPWVRQSQLLFAGGFAAAGLGGEQDSHLYFTPMP